MWNIISKIGWKGWVAIIVGILIIWQVASGGALTRKYVGLALDNLRADQSNVIKIKEEQEKWYEGEIAKLNDQMAKKDKDIATLKSGITSRDEVISRLEGEKNDLKRKLEEVVVSDDPNLVIKSLQRKFPSLRRKQ